MCGIGGIFSFNSQVEIGELKKMTNIISHRGPDGEGHWINKTQNIGLGHRRLSIIDLSDKAAQPMHSPCGRYTITFNGEIYNYLELKKKLEEKGEIFYSSSDTEVLLRMYMLEGEKCLDVLDGMWSFAIWDDLKRELFCSRDRFGEKPFYYYYDKNKFVFSSEIKSFWSIGISKQNNKELFSNFLINGFIQNPDDLTQTFYDNIINLPHSHFLIVNAKGEIKTKKYFNINWKNINYEISFDEAKEKFKELFENSLKNRLRSDVPIGTSLSGGLDSSVIVCNIIKHLNSSNLTPKTFSARFLNFEKDEGYFMNKIIEKTKVDPYFTFPTEDDLIKDFDKLCYHQEEPFASSSIYAQYKVQKLASESNVTVLIDGQGADEILGGYLYYYPVYIRELEDQLIKKYKTRKRERKSFIDFHTDDKQSIFLNNNYIQDTIALLRKVKSGLGATSVKSKFNQNGKEYYFAVDKPLNKALYMNTMQIGLQGILRYADKNSMAWSREIRLPFLNYQLVEFLFTLPSEYKLNEGWTKYIMRKAYEDVLPKEITWRKDKIGFEPPQKKWINNKQFIEIINEGNNKILSKGFFSNTEHISNWNKIMAYYYL